MRFRHAFPVVAFVLSACGSSSNETGRPGSDAGSDVATNDGGTDAGGVACAGPCPASKVKYLVVIVQENHTFDNHFGRYCTAATGSSPTCNDGPACCEAAPDKDPSGASPGKLDDGANGGYNPNHTQACELSEMNGGKMDRFVAGVGCADPRNFAYADATTVQPLWDLAKSGAIGDRYFQPIAGASGSNNMYFARAQFVFKDNTSTPANAVGSACSLLPAPKEYSDKTLGDLLDAKQVPWVWYAEGYQTMKDANGACPNAPADCASGVQQYPCVYDPGDDPSQFYPQTRDGAVHHKDYNEFTAALAGGTLPAVSFVKALGYHTEHPGDGTKLSDGVKFVKGVVDAVMKSAYKDDVLVLLTYDEGGGYFDHVAPPGMGADNQPYGTRVPFVAMGPFARKNYVSHVTMEHSSIVKFVEWNWLGGTGQLDGRDKTVANIGSVLDPAKTGTAVPEN